MGYEETAGSGARIAVGAASAVCGFGLATLFPPVRFDQAHGGRRDTPRSLYAASAGAAIVLLALGRTWQAAGLGIILGILIGSTAPLLRRRSEQLGRFRR
jgi:hypothetical protein